MNIKVVEAEEGGFWADAPGPPGCASQGETMEELIANIREAIAGWLGGRRRPYPRVSMGV
jgi:predicted RNase H-like HicB family nuclease